jgi:acyl carrier protein
MTDHEITIEIIGSLVAAQLGRKLPAGTVITPETNFEALGLSSIDFTEIFFAIEERLGFELDPAEAADVKTTGELLAVIDRLVAKHKANT